MKLRTARWLPRMLGVVLLATGAGCTQLTQAEIKALETRELDLPFNEAYQAAANGLFSLGFTIAHSDKESGIVSGTRHDPCTGAKITNTIFFGALGLAATSDRNEAVSFMLSRIEDTVTQLRMKVVVNGKPVVDRKLMTQIWQQIEREAMLDAGPPQPPVQPAAMREPAAEAGGPSP